MVFNTHDLLTLKNLPDCRTKTKVQQAERKPLTDIQIQFWRTTGCLHDPLSKENISKDEPSTDIFSAGFNKTESRDMLPRGKLWVAFQKTEVPFGLN